MIIVDHREKKASSQQHKTKIFDCLAHIRSAKNHFYAKKGDL